MDTTENVLTGEGSYLCREDGCTFTAEYTQVRASHERREHGFRVTKDGEMIRISDELLSDEDLQALILRVATDAEEPESKYYFWQEARRQDPRVAQRRIFRVLEEMAASSQSDLVAHGTSDHYTYYTLASRVSQKAAELVYTYLNEEVSITTTEPEPTPVSNGLIGDHIANVRKLLTDLEVLDSMELELNADLQAELAATKNERDQLKAELATTKDELKAVQHERDQLKAMLNAIRTQVLKGGHES